MSAKTNTLSKNCGPSRVARECRGNDRLKHSTNNIRVPEPQPKKINVNSKVDPKKPSTVTSQVGRKKSSLNEEIRPKSINLERNNKTWYQVLLESPEKSKHSKILKTNHSNQSEIPCRCRSALNENFLVSKENFAPRSGNTRRFNLLVDMLFERINETNDKNFLKIVHILRTLLDNPNHPYFVNEYQSRTNLLTDDDKYTFQKPPVQPNEKSNKSSDMLLKALIKETKDQREMLQNLNVQIAQLREENKMLSQLKDARMNLESKLASRTMETKCMKKEYEKIKYMLEMRDKENENLRNRLSILKVATNGKINYLFDNCEDHPEELVANPPLHEASFDLPIRPASSSPSEENAPAENRSKRTSQPKDLYISLAEETRIRAEMKNNNEETRVRAEMKNTEETRVRTEMKNNSKLKELKEDVNKFIAVLEADMASLNANDISLNLSDVTYQGNV